MSRLSGLKKLYSIKKYIGILLFAFIVTLPQTVIAVDTPGAVILPETASPVETPTQTNSTCTTTGFKYKTLVTIPGLGEDGVVTICPSSLGTYLQTIFNYIIGIAIALAVVMIIYGGVTYATTDAVGGKAEGKTIIKDALYGLALALGSFLILNTINPDLLKFDLELPVLKTVVTQDGGSVAVVRNQLQVVGELQNGISGGNGASLLNTSGPSQLANLATARAAARRNGIDETTFACQMGQENRFRNTGTSSAGASGPAQIMPDTGRASVARGGCGFTSSADFTNPERAYGCAARIMRDNLRTYNGNITDALMAYNWGSGNLQDYKAGRKTLPSETRNYVANITNCATTNRAAR